MNHKKSMRIFWLSLSLLLVSGVIIIAAAQFRTHKKAAMDHARQQNANGQDAEETKMDDDTTDTPTTAAKNQAEENDTLTDKSLQQTNGKAADYLYELKIRNGCLEVYYYHTERLFLHTGIPYDMLTINQRRDLQEGKYFKNEQELYGYLESCTS